MQIVIFSILVTVAIIFIFLSYHYGNSLVLIRYACWLSLFLICLNCMLNGVEYQTGATISEDAGITTITNIDTTYTNHTGFFILTIMCGYAFVLCFFENRQGDGIDA